MKSMKLLAVLPGNCIQSLSKNFSTGPASLQRQFKILVVGAGAGGCSVANKFAHHVGGEKVGVIEPNDVCIASSQLKNIVSIALIMKPK